MDNSTIIAISVIGLIIIPFINRYRFLTFFVTPNKAAFLDLKWYLRFILNKGKSKRKPYTIIKERFKRIKRMGEGQTFLKSVFDKDADFLINALRYRIFSNELYIEMDEMVNGRNTSKIAEQSITNNFKFVNQTTNIQKNIYNSAKENKQENPKNSDSKKQYSKSNILAEPTLMEKILYHVKYLIESEEHQQAIRYGHFFIQLGLLKPSKSDAKTSLKEWKEVLSNYVDIKSNVMTATPLMTNPFRIQGRKWTIDNTIPNIIEMIRFFESIKCENGVKKVLEEVTFNDELEMEFKKQYPKYDFKS